MAGVGVLVHAAVLALHEDVAGLGRAVRAHHRGVEDRPDVPPVEERRELVGQGDERRLVRPSALARSVAAEAAQERGACLQHRGPEELQLVQHPVEVAVRPRQRVDQLVEVEEARQAAPLQGQRPGALHAHVERARQDRLPVVPRRRPPGVSVELPGGPLGGVPPGLVPGVLDPLLGGAAGRDQLDLSAAEPLLQGAPAGHEGRRGVEVHEPLGERRQRPVALLDRSAHPAVEGAPRSVGLHLAQRLVERRGAAGGEGEGRSCRHGSWSLLHRTTAPLRRRRVGRLRRPRGWTSPPRPPRPPGWAARSPPPRRSPGRARRPAPASARDG